MVFYCQVLIKSSIKWASLTSSSIRTLLNRPKALTGSEWRDGKIGESPPAEWAGLGAWLEVDDGSSSSEDIVSVTEIIRQSGWLKCDCTDLQYRVLNYFLSKFFFKSSDEHPQYWQISSEIEKTD